MQNVMVSAVIVILSLYDLYGCIVYVGNCILDLLEIILVRGFTFLSGSPAGSVLGAMSGLVRFFLFLIFLVVWLVYLCFCPLMLDDNMNAIYCAYARVSWRRHHI